MKLTIIGIPKWDWKKPLREFAEEHPNVEEIDIDDRVQ